MFVALLSVTKCHFLRRDVESTVCTAPEYVKSLLTTSLCLQHSECWVHRSTHKHASCKDTPQNGQLATGCSVHLRHNLHYVVIVNTSTFTQHSNHNNLSQQSSQYPTGKASSPLSASLVQACISISSLETKVPNIIANNFPFNFFVLTQCRSLSVTGSLILT